MQRTIISGATVATVDANGTEYPDGWVVFDDATIVGVGGGVPPEWAVRGLTPSGETPAVPPTIELVDGTGHLLTPGLINTHHHLYQWLTRGWAQDSILFDWLVALYPAWSMIDAELVESGAEAAIAVLARSGCTTVADHHYVFPKDSGDILGGIIAAATRVGVRLHGTRGSMDLGRSQGGLPPDFAVETTSAALQASADAVARYHDPSREAMVQIAIAPCSPFSVTSDLLSEAAVLARSLDVRLHTHGSETVEEDAFCLEKWGKTPTQYLDDLGWLGNDVWMAHCVHLDDSAIGRFAATGTGVAHCPSSNARLAAGIAPVPQLLAAGVPVGLGVDGAASNESGQLGSEIRQSVLMNRLRAGADGMTGRHGLYIATMGGARVLGRSAELGSIEVGKLADLVLWKVDRVEHAGIADPVAALTLGAQPPVTRSFVHGRTVVEDGELTRVDERAVARAASTAATALAVRAGVAA
ncbi:cytosine/adenosine deaminase-related metal-dependent hydrolase [Conyzicola lurida]|uniref:Cytosine/adenosine deaminase-related metal-dependent hydrolase n=1 Tax=Conyzicola lurida TaxID=1172621 RepID=A0A841ALF9_9MICO|nr:8-oxoguanine deaminase [Conyzicola lurida]MBB5843188.1 cytosine/adenosine deaminase-related metal-dependent hydrolase [Conyzicola lurida]